MNYFAGLDVSLEWTSVCVVDKDGKIFREAKVLSEPDALVAFFAELEVDITRICLNLIPYRHVVRFPIRRRPCADQFR